MTRAPVKLSREMKLLLMLLLMVGLIGLWYVWTSSRAGDQQGQQASPTATTGPAGSNPDAVPITTPGVGTGEGTGTPDSTQETPAIPVQPDPQVQVEVIPPFPTTEPGAEAGTPAPTGEAAVPSGINPDGLTASAPGSNPFRPLSLDSSGDAAPTPGAPLAGQNPIFGSSTPPIAASVAVPAPIAATSSTDSVDMLGSAGPMSISPIPGSDGSVSVTPGTSAGGALPVPVIPGADGSTGTGTTTVVPVGPAGTVPVSAVPAPASPPPPPVAGVSVPRVTRLPDVLASAAPTPATPPAPTAVPAPLDPQLIRELGRGEAGAAGTPTNPLADYVQSRALVFNAVVLGPVNTAIFRGKDGYVVVSTGQALPDSQVVVKEVTATTATLSLGTDSTTLELDKR